jgi:mannose-6-phosphate isomerase-like protein (cupin superfamily)
MSGFTVKNLKEIEVSERARELSFEARFGRRHIDSDHLGVSYFRYPPGFHTSFGHHHEVQEEAYVVVGGSGRAKLDDEIIELRQWDLLRVAPPVVRAFEGGPEGLELIAVGSDRPSGPESEAHTVNDFWTS